MYDGWGGTELGEIGPFLFSLYNYTTVVVDLRLKYLRAGARREYIEVDTLEGGFLIKRGLILL